jgi:hypothetical protein
VTSAPQYTYAAEGASYCAGYRQGYENASKGMPAGWTWGAYEEGYRDGFDASDQKACLSLGREMCLNDLEAPTLRRQREEAASVEAIALMKHGVRPSILSRLKAWWRR